MNGDFVDVCVVLLIAIAAAWIFWRFRWWPLSRLRARQERLFAENDAYLAHLGAEKTSDEPPDPTPTLGESRLTDD